MYLMILIRKTKSMIKILECMNSSKGSHVIMDVNRSMQM
jgi:hypothetical protein